MRRLAVAVALIMGLTAAPAGAVDIITVNQNAMGSPNLQTGRLARLGPVGTCAAPAPAESLIDEDDQFGYINHTLRSSLTNPICFEVDISTACAEIFSVGYLGAFDPANPRTRYAASSGASFPAPYSFTVPPGSPISVVVHSVTESPTCGAYSVTFRSDGPWVTIDSTGGPPRITGIPELGGVLTGADANWVNPLGTIVERRWQRCDMSGAACVDIPGATAGTYTVSEADLGSTLRFRNDATDADGTSGSHSEPVEPFLPFETRASESLGPGDRVHQGLFVRSGLETRCGAPTTVPAILQPANSFLYDTFAVTSLLNEPVCLVARTDPACFNGVTPSLFDPAFDPVAGLSARYAGHSGRAFSDDAAVSNVLPPAGSRELVVTQGSTGPCDSYEVVLGADAPFATARPAVAGATVEGETLTGGDGTWSGTPALTRSWLRCDAAGAACTAIPGATGASYVPGRADVGARLRLRVTATRGRLVSSDSEPSGVVAAETRAPSWSLRLGSRNLRKALRSGQIPVRVRSDEAGRAVLRLSVSRRVARRLKLGRKRVIASVRRAVPAGRRVTLRAKLTRKARRKLRDARSVRLTIAGSVTDAAGNAASRSRAATLKRPQRR